jgi:preprotein translocase subunit SecD
MPKKFIGVAGVAMAVALSACGTQRQQTADQPCTGPGTGGPRAAYRAEPTPAEPAVTAAGLESTIAVMCKRAHALGAEGARIVRLRSNRIVVRLGPGKNAEQTAKAVGVPARISLYDWDNNVVGNADRPLPDLIQAVRRASSRSPQPETEDLPMGGAEEQTTQRLNDDPEKLALFYDELNDASGPSYWTFRGEERLAGPETSCAGLLEALSKSRRQARGAIREGDIGAADCAKRLSGRSVLPQGSQVFVVPRGVRIVQAPRPGGGAPGTTATGDPGPSPGWFVLEDDAGLTSDDIDDADPIKDEVTGTTGVRLKFTKEGAEKYRSLTAGIAEKGREDPTGASPRLAIVFDDQVLSLGSIDPQTSPEGLDPDAGARIPNVGGQPRAELLSKLIESGALPLEVRPVP